MSTGLATGFFSTSRVPMPVKTPLPAHWLPGFQAFLRQSIIGSSILWRVAKRTLVGTILFAVLECDFKDVSHCLIQFVRVGVNNSECGLFGLYRWSKGPRKSGRDPFWLVLWVEVSSDSEVCGLRCMRGVKLTNDGYLWFRWPSWYDSWNGHLYSLACRRGTLCKKRTNSIKDFQSMSHIFVTLRRTYLLE